MSTQEGPKRFRIISDQDSVYIAQDANRWLESVSAEEQARLDAIIRDPNHESLGTPTPIETNARDRHHSNGHGSFLSSQSMYEGTSGRGTPRRAITSPRPRPVNS